MTKKIFLLLIPFILLRFTDSFGAVVYPENILFKRFSEQCISLDSIRDSIQKKDFKTAVSEYDTFENWANDKGDIQLKFTLRWYKYHLILVREKYDSLFENKITDLINDADENNLKYLKAAALELLADYYWRVKKYALSLENHIYAYESYSLFSIDDFPRKADFLYDLGGKYYYFRDFKAAKKFFLEAWNNIPVEKISGPVSKLNTLALCYSNLDEYDSAEYYFKKDIKLAEKNNDELWLGIISGNLGNVYLKQKRYDEAKPLLEKNIELSRKHHALDDLALSLSEYGTIFLLKNDAKKDLQLQMEAYNIMKSKSLFNNYQIVARIYPNIAKAYAANGNPAMAYSFLDSGKSAHDSLEAQRNMTYVSGVQHKIDVERHKAELQRKEAELKHQKLFRNSFIAGFLIFMLASVVFFIQNKRIKKEKKRSDELLLNILPVEVAEELKETGTAKAKNFGMATVMFTDFKDFTAIGEQMSPEQLVGEINHCFSSFDKIIHKFGIEKIKTMGDSYMCVGGLPVVNNSHPEDAINAAKEILKFMENHKNEKLTKGGIPFEIRIGIHTGPVVAGIVGVKKFAYDIWGDTVNLASRMESSGEAGKINISGSTYELVKNIFNCTYRGKIQAKNKGEMDMYFVGERITDQHL